MPNCVCNALNTCSTVEFTLLIAVSIALTACVYTLLKVCVAMTPIPVVADVVVAAVVAGVVLLLTELLAVLTWLVAAAV